MKKYFILLIIICGCEKELPKKYYPDRDYKPEPYVFSIISPNKQKVFVGKTLRAGDTLPEDYRSRWIGVSGAKVKMICEGDTINFVENTAQRGIYEADFTPQNLKTYTLEVIYPDNKKVIGKTTIPGKFEILKPQNLATISKNDTLIWSSSKYAEIYNIRLLGKETLRTWWVRDTIFLFSEVYIPENDTIIIKILGLDKNYYNYEILEEIQKLGDGIGVFGSFSATDTIIVYTK